MGSLLERLFDVEPPEPGQDLNWDFALPGMWPGWVVLLFVVVSIGCFTYLYRRDGGSVSWKIKLPLLLIRLTIVFIVLLMIWGLDVRVERRGLPYLVVAIDSSESMSIADQYRDANVSAEVKRLTDAASMREPTRLNLAKASLLKGNQRLLRKLARDHRLLIYSLSEKSTRLGEFNNEQKIDEAVQQLIDIEPDGSESRLGSGLRSILKDLSGTPPTAVIVMTDGVTTSGETLPNSARLAQLSQIPIYTVGVGDSETDQDLELRDLLVDKAVFVDDIVNFQVKLISHGLDEGTARVILRKQGENSPVATQDVQLGDAPTSVSLQFRPTEVADIDFEVEVEPLDRELKTDNNLLTAKVSVREQKLKVLLVETYPRSQYRFMKHLLERDQTMDLHVLLLEADPEHPEQDRAAINHFPTSRNELESYDVILMGDVSPGYLTTDVLKNLQSFVTEYGGGVAFMCGSRYMPYAFRNTPLNTIIPVDFDGLRSVVQKQEFKPALTLEGQLHPIFRLGGDESESQSIWGSLPGSFWYVEVPRPKAGALSLVVHPTAMGDDAALPIILTQQVGAGRVLMLNIDNTWRWRDMVGDVYMSRFWVQSIRYLSRARLLNQSRQAELSSDRRQYERGQPVGLRVRLFDETLVPTDDATATVLLEQPDGLQQQIDLTRVSRRGLVFGATVTELSEGSYRAVMISPTVRDNPPTTTFSIAAPPGEFRRIEMDRAGLEQTSELTGGQFYSALNADRLQDAIPPGRKIPLDSDPPIVLWNTWFIYLLFFLLILTEWLLRKRYRMM